MKSEGVTMRPAGAQKAIKTIDVRNADKITLRVGDTVTLHSLRQAVVPPYLMLSAFIQTPPGLAMQEQHALPGEGLHGVDYDLKATAPGTGDLVVGFRDLRTNKVTHEKRLQVVVDA
jgi:hypothetical protein